MNKGFAQNPANQQYERLATDIDRAIKFMEAAGADSTSSSASSSTPATKAC